MSQGQPGLFKGTTNPPKWAGVSTYLALTFGTLLSSQGTDASFVLTLSGFPPGFRSVFRVSNLTRSAFRSVSGSVCVSGGRRSGLLPFGLSPTLSEPFPPS
ncbi:hypothetical protein BGM19_15885 [Streptomyces agglomeratus]|nr:hypothetical protein BGM19_15885 [Streptomyces agglomeratus]